MSVFPESHIDAAQAAQRKWGVPTSISLAQDVQESGGGKFIPPGSNNVLGIQALTGLPSVSAESFEYKNGVRYDVVEHFAAFTSVAQCFDKHGELIATSRAYRYAMACLPRGGGVPTQDQVNAFAANLAHVYATAPNYLTGLLAIMKSERLYALDVAGPAFPAPSASPMDTSAVGSTAWIQAKLNAAGASPQLAVDGVSGDATKNAIMKFQAAKHLTVDGLVGLATIDALKAL